MTDVAHVGYGLPVVEGFIHIVQQLELTVLDPTLYYAPTAVTVAVEGGWPGQVVSFEIDDAEVYADTLDSSGALGPISLPVSAAHGAGQHTITVTSADSSVATGTFTLQNDPHEVPRVVGPDADPIDVPASHTATGVRRWVLQDLLPGGLGSWVLPRNPSSCSPFPSKRTLQQSRTTTNEGRYSIFEVAIEPHDFQFSGFIRTKDEHDKFLAYTALNRRIYLIDHRGRAWTAVLVSPDIVARKRISENDGTFNDWAADYTISAVIHGTEWKVPQ